MKLDVDSLDWEKGDGLVPAIVQDVGSGRVLMLAFVSRESLAETLKSGWATFWSRSRQQIWRKGDTSGNRLRVAGVSFDCDRDAVLLLVRPEGPACHTGAVSCFTTEARLGVFSAPADLESLIRGRRQGLPEGSYTSALFKAGLPEIAKKVGEEAVEVVVSALQDPDRTAEESADLLYHLLVFLVERGVSWERVCQILANRGAGSAAATSLLPGE